MNLDLSAIHVPEDLLPERKMWMSTLYQALADLDKPTRWAYVPIDIRHQWKSNPYVNEVWRSAMTLIFSGREDDHQIFAGSQIDPEALRQNVLRMMANGEITRPPGEKSLPYYGVDYRRARVHLMRGYDWAATKFRRPMDELFAKDCHKQVRQLLEL